MTAEQVTVVLCVPSSRFSIIWIAVPVPLKLTLLTFEQTVWMLDVALGSSSPYSTFKSPLDTVNRAYLSTFDIEGLEY